MEEAEVPGQHDIQREEFLNKLELAYRAKVQQQSDWVKTTPRSLLDLEHKSNYYKVKTIQKLSSFLKPIISHKKSLTITLSPVLIIVIAFTVYSVFLPKTINYSFASSTNCTSSPLLSPGLFKSSTNATFSLSRSKSKISSGSICAKAEDAPKGDSSYSEKEWLNILGVHLSKKVTIKTSSYAASKVSVPNVSELPIEKPLTFKLSSDDLTFSYAISTNGLTAPCQKTDEDLSCNLAPLKLSYGSPYKVKLVRTFNNQIVNTSMTQQVQTVTATAITATSISAGSVVEDKPQQLVITTSKPLTKVENITLTYPGANGAPTSVPVTDTVKGNQITVNWTTVLPRQTNFMLGISKVDATDYSTLEAPYSLAFSTSGGPSVTSSNIPSFGLASGQPMNIAFSQALDPNQNFGSEVSLLVNGQAAASTVSLSGDHLLVVTPAAAYPVCATVKVVVSATVDSTYDISGNSAYSYSSRSHCYTTFSIGTSVQGRPITAYQFGNGPSMVLYIANMEGNERNSADLLNQWLPDVDANPQKIPADRTLVIIPSINPDGYAANTRLNAAGIDLNRNFPANNWSEQVTEPLGNGVVTNDGGATPLDTPESQALANYFIANKPRLTITEHSHGGIVEANDAADSDALGAEYAKLAGYKPIPTKDIGNFFDYTTTGAFEDWVHDKYGLAVLEVELRSPTADEYSQNLPALWAMANVSP